MSQTILDHEDIPALGYIVTHVFFPLKLPNGDDHSVRNDYSLAAAIASAARIYSSHVDDENLPEWHRISAMLGNLQATVQFESLDRAQTISQLSSMNTGDVLAFFIAAQNAAIIFRKQEDATIFESFEASPKVDAVVTTQGRLICSYPGPAIQIPNTVLEQEGFRCELVNFLVRMNTDVLDVVPKSRTMQTDAGQVRDTADPRYITELLTGILRGVGGPAEVVRISKRVGDDVVPGSNRKSPWRRSPLWLLIKVVLQTSLERFALGRDAYKQFMLFFTCRLAQEQICADLPNDFLQCMSAKISRRLRKLGSSAPDWLSTTALEACSSLRSILEQRWGQVQDAQRVSPIWDPRQLDLIQDCQLSLSNSHDYLQDALASRNIPPPDTPFLPTHRPRGTLGKFLSLDGAFFEEAYRGESHVALYDFECAVEQDIDSWVDCVESHDEACVKLEVLANKYSANALKTYQTNPELLSVMLLTVTELWIALDKIAIKAIPMLADYSPEIPTRLLEGLLLCKAVHLRRLRRAHQYLSDRCSGSKSQWSVFSSTFDSSSFAVSFYETSSHHQCLKALIEEVAQGEVREKIAELERENARHAELREIADNSDHQYVINRHGDEEHADYCDKCSYERSLKSMEIALHEWPLPAEKLRAEVVVFELDCPVSFNMWRTATLHLLVDLCSPSVGSTFPYVELTKYSALQPYLVQHPRSRVSLGSSTKLFVDAHHRKTSIPATTDQVCVKNGLTFYGFDVRAKIAVSEASSHFDISRYCTYRLQSGPYQNLQKYVGVATHTSNEILANQADCHKDLSIHEYMAFGHLRSGGLLQWLNILRELRGRSLGFRRTEVHFLLAQAASQVGPLINGEWAWHEEIRQPPFCNALLAELESLLRDVEANWQEAVTMDTISFLLRRILVSAPDQAITQEALRLLGTARGKAFSRVRELSARIMNAPGDEGLRGILRNTAAICRSTFDIDTSLFPKLLHSAGDIEVLLSCAILIHDHTPSDVSRLPGYSRLLLDRDRRLALSLENFVTDLIQTDSSDRGINLAVGRVWPRYRPGSKWVPLESPNSRWLSSKTAQRNEQRSQDVHFNLLDGTLLVNGQPLGRLPSDILRHPLYALIFSEKIFDVIPSDLPGMDYVTRCTVSGHQVYFSLRNNGSDLVIRAKSDSELIELIPQAKLKGDIPDVLIEGHAHWLNVSSSVMEIRPLDSLWRGSSENWKIDCIAGQYRMHKGHEDLIDMRSPSWTMVSAFLKPLDAPSNLLITVSPVTPGQPSSSQLYVTLPRYRLSFYVDVDGDLQSHNMRGMVCDENQSAGALFGLTNWLVLRSKPRGNPNAIELIPRCILIPEGKISFGIDGHHVRVEIDIGGPALRRITYQTYRIDTDLGYLTGNGSLTSKLYCAYLHALTSGCGTDPLTGRTGTEEALSLLRSASCSSIMRLGPHHAELLGLIASICPFHACWRELPVNSQHVDLYFVSKAIKDRCERTQLFHENQSRALFQGFPWRSEHLLRRRAGRTAYLHPSEASEQRSGPNSDVSYTARDTVQAKSGEHTAYIVATSVHCRTATPMTPKDILGIMESWSGTVSGKSGTLSLRYDRSWLAPDLPSIWLAAYNLLRKSGEEKWFQLLFTLPAMAYASSELDRLVPVLVAFAADSRFSLEDPPHYDSYKLSDGYCPSSSTLRAYVSNCAHAFQHSPESKDPQKSDESDRELQKRRGKMFKERVKSDADATIEWLMSAWPCETPPECSLKLDLYHMAVLRSNVQSHFSCTYHNFKLKEHLTRVQKILEDVRSHAFPTPAYTFHPSTGVAPCVSWSSTLEGLFARPVPLFQAHDEDKLPRYPADFGHTSFSSAAPLHQLIAKATKNAVNQFQKQYVSALHDSAKSFGSGTSLVAHGATKRPTTGTLSAHYDLCRANYTKRLHDLKQYLSPISKSEQTVERSGQWPRVTAYTLFRSFASNSPTRLSDDWKKCLIKLTLLALELQRSRRLLRLHFDNLHEEFLRELQNEGCDGWVAESRPDWLLVQLQSNFLVRRVQANVANEMIAPSSGANSVMQLNMGEGKSSVIIPIVVVVLADGHQLVRVVVPKVLMSQMFHLLADCLGGLANRRIYFVPFTRSLEVDDNKVGVLHALMSECMKDRGILVTQPEHILSLRLVGVEKMLSQAKHVQLANALLNLQKWLHAHSRDILDECDEILHVRYQLVYTIGHQQDVEGSPERWTTTEQVLRLVGKHASSLRDLFPLRVEYEEGPPGSFPRLRILHADAGQVLIARIVRDIMSGSLPSFSFRPLHPRLRNAVRSFISRANAPSEHIRLVKEYTQETPLWSGLLLLRGLLATGILLYAFRERRWRVDYGLAPTRTMLAVPYRAKDIPAQRAEFGHPDIAIILTCLSYYYSGLSEEQLRVSFEILLKQDDPSLDYDPWVQDCPAVPDGLRTISGINIRSSEQWKESLVPLFSRNRTTVNFYLSNIVFPKEAKEFPSKLSCSGWDIAETKERLVTGFSGTNDGQYLLPLHIDQRDPDHQRGTNAKVLAYLLQPENRHYMCMAKESGERRTTREFIETLVAQKPEIRVLLDVGAQMLDLQNHELAQVWLDVKEDASAAIYFNEDDELTVRTRDGTTQLLISSPFAQQLDQCIVYLDDAHTRGTDIKFPSGFRGAVTLGPKVTKDRLAQGCMRMRKLGQEHAVMFFAPFEVDRRIRAVAGKDEDCSAAIDTADILHWAIHETCDDIHQRVPYWVQQGLNHASRYDAWSSFCRSKISSKTLSDKWLQPEAKRLEDLYGRHGATSPASLADSDIRRRCMKLGVLSLPDVNMDEEQEREIVHEAEREQHVERSPRVPPASHSLHEDVRCFVATGFVPTNTKAFLPAFETLNTTSAASNEVHVWSPRVLATTDFQKTVGSRGKLDEYLRPVQWVVSGKRGDDEVLVILSPHEVNQLIPSIRSSDKVHLHVYTPHVTKSMKPCDDLALYSTPTVPADWTPSPSLMDQLNVFAGQLYLKDYETYIRLCRFLCLYTRDLEGTEGIEVGSDGFILPKNRPSHLATTHTFQKSPIVSLTTLMRLRRKGMRFALTHMGKLTDGHLLSEDDFHGCNESLVDQGNPHGWSKMYCSCSHRALQSPAGQNVWKLLFDRYLIESPLAHIWPTSSPDVLILASNSGGLGMLQ